ncbi:MAG: hypothetical protein WED04_06945 [Promethearchaeati archaeon SRVP18_Atabeyarchaeia-1]
MRRSKSKPIKKCRRGYEARWDIIFVPDYLPAAFYPFGKVF